MQHHTRTYFFSSIVLTALLLLTACSTKKNTAITRTYHNVTSYYNVYFNGKDAMEQGLKKMDKAHVDNYSMVLPVFKHSNKETSRAAFSDMNRAIEKGAKCVRKHSITVKPKKKEGQREKKDKMFYEKPEYVNWVDDAYLMVGKGHFYKQDYFPAIETFSYIIKQYTDWPIKYDAYLWLSRTYTEMGKFDKATELLAMIEGDKGKYDKSLLADIYSTQADILIRQQKYAEAIASLEKCIQATTHKPNLMRFNYILAQLYERMEETRKAYETYGIVIDLSPPYEMAFNAKINRAGLFNADASDSRELQRQLYKMLKDEKNLDYRDQIYFALGNIARNETRLADAIDLYQQSVAVSTKNTNQKAVSYLTIADIYFEEPIYPNAQAYYDSAVAILSKDYPGYFDIKAKSQNLNELVKYLTIIDTQDSLQRVARMPEAQRYAVIDGIIKDLIAEEIRQKEEAARNQQNTFASQNLSSTQSQGAGAWYFYNPNMLSLGQAEFKKTWGARKLEDNWRRKNKSVLDLASFGTDPAEGPKTDSAAIKLNKKSREFYLVNLPMTDSAIKASNLQIAEAYFNVGNLYKDRFNDVDQSINAYNRLLSLYPGSVYEPAALYNLYKLSTLNRDKKGAEEYKQRLIAQYPESDYAKILNNPEYFAQLAQHENKLNFLYQATYRYFLAGNCTEVDNNFHYVDTSYADSKLLPKFALLSTLCSGRNGDTVAFKARLKAYIAMYPNGDEKAYASEVLAALDRKPREVEVPEEKPAETFGSELAQTPAENLDISMYQHNPGQMHYYLVVVQNDKTDANRIRFNLTDFNLDYYSYLEFEVSNILLSANFTAVVVKKFKNQSMASNYNESVIIAGEVFQGVPDDAYRSYIISADNFTKFYEDKNLQRYEKFYQLNYHK